MILTRKFIFIIIGLLVFFAFRFEFNLNSNQVFAETEKEKLEQVQEDISVYEAEIQKLRGEANTLSNQIAQFNAQINLTYLRISQTEEKIRQLGGRIDQLETSLQGLTKAFNHRAVRTFKMARLNQPYLMILTSDDLSDAVSSFHYIKKIQESDRDLITRLEQAQGIYTAEKTDQEHLQKELLEHEKVLSAQKSAKDSLLEQTKANEGRYQELLAQALAEKAALEKAVATGIEVGPVSRGDIIGLVGNSGYPGCSTGKHLHLEIRKNGSWVNPASFFESRSMKDEQNGGAMITLGNGNWPWPIQDTIRLTQHYGNTPYSWRYSYSGGVHTGIDMVSTTSDVLRAPADGTLYKSTQSCGANSSPINIVYIDHGDDLLSFYLHVQ